MMPRRLRRQPGPAEPAPAYPPRVAAALTLLSNRAVTRWAKGQAGSVPVTRPGDRVEQQAAGMARQALDGRSSSAAVPASHPVGARELPFTDGRPLPDRVRGRMEQGFGAGFEDVRVHTSGDSHALTRALNAHAVTVGPDIFFGRSAFAPGQPSGDALLAHELAHVVQQRAAGGGGAPVSRWAFLGQENWTVLGTQYVTKVWAGTEAEWRRVLKEADNEDVYQDSLRGFLEVANDSSRVGRDHHPNGFAEYQNSITRAPTGTEIMEFLRALYGLGEDLDLVPHWLWGSGPYLHFLRPELARFLGRHQGELIKLASIEGIDGDKAIDQGGVAAVAEEGGKLVRISMVNSAITTAAEGFAHLIRAHAEGDEGAKSDAYSIIGNAGLVIRSTLDVHEEAIKFEGEVNMFLIDLALDLSQADEIPGVQTLLRRTPAVKSLLKNSVKKMGAGAASSGDPMKQAAAIATQFENDAKRLGPAAGTDSVLDANTERLAITTFAAALGKK